MRFFLSAEVQNEVGEALRHAENKIRKLIVPKLSSDYGSDVDLWCQITILRPKIPPGWGEVAKFHVKDRIAEFRLIIEYGEFKAAVAEKQVQMLVGSILRSIELFPGLKVKEFDIERFRRDILDAAVAGGLMPAEDSTVTSD